MIPSPNARTEPKGSNATKEPPFMHSGALGAWGPSLGGWQSFVMSDGSVDGMMARCPPGGQNKEPILSEYITYLLIMDSTENPAYLAH